MSSEGTLTLVVGLLSSGVLTVLVTGLLSRRKTSADTTLVLTEAAGKIIEQLQNRVTQVEEDLKEERVARREAEAGRRAAEAQAEKLARDLAYFATMLVEEANRADAAARLREYHDRLTPNPSPAPTPLPGPAPTPDPGGTP